MTQLRELLRERGITRAAVIDDAYDCMPYPDDLSEVDWYSFFDDLTAEDEELLRELHPQYSESSFDQLTASPEFIATLWNHRAQLKSDAITEVFEDYESNQVQERARLDSLVMSLSSLGLSCSTMGRHSSADAQVVDLLFVDLYLGSQQLDRDMERAVALVRNLVGPRADSPPLVVLMSRSSRLVEKRNEFRDEAGLLGSTFRVIEKRELEDEPGLFALLSRLARHYEDAKRFAAFLNSWENALTRARSNFIQALRRVDLPDLGQIRALLLNFEGQDLGEYLLDVADRVLQYEIEHDEPTIASALELNKVDLDEYPAPHLEGTNDLQELVHRMIFQHRDRLVLSQSDGKRQLRFGDLLRWKKDDAEAISDNVSLVVSPACDLVRDGADQILLVSGTLGDLLPKSWTYKDQPLRTAIVILPCDTRKWIRWNLSGFQTLPFKLLHDWAFESDKVSVIGRLRDPYVTQIQQKLLSSLGRVGPAANLPVPFPVAVSAYYVGPDSKARRLGVRDIEVAACYVGRGSDPQPVHRLVLTEKDCDAIEKALRSIPVDSVARSAQASLEAIRQDRDLFERLVRGDIGMSFEQGSTPTKGPDKKIYAMTIRGGDFGEGSSVSGDAKRAALILKISDTT